jgi:hypothetical protein
MIRVITLVVSLFTLGQARAQEPPLPKSPTLHLIEMPAELRAWYRNPDGSCVQCSIGMCGIIQNCPPAYTLLWDTEYGKKVRGGSWPERVAGYCEARQIPAYNVTGSGTLEWMRWGIKTGRPLAIGAARAHFQTLLGYDDQGTADESDDLWYVCNNNSTQKIDRYTDKQFRNLHYASGPWVVVLDLPPAPVTPRYHKWW